ncbi:Sodium/hydrogen exchanger family-domain-containing protein [Cyathus striatus]|nr:Sodium/hydrogen exchanger family-domain-containing protein [Cyathus striatus]
MPEFSTAVISLFQKRAASEQGGLLTGKDPSAFNESDPIRLWIIQVGIIVCTASLLSLGLRKLRQPKVIAEVLGGIILGPTAFGRIPGFSEHIFPDDSQPYLSLVANIGLCLFLFLVGLEIDSAVIKRNARLSATISLAGMILPFGFGAALAVPLYHEFIDSSVKFTHFMLFTGVAYSITAFPVLCRILTELKLLDTTVGIIVLSAGVGNDIIGWTLLALAVALVNAGSGLTALWILMVCVGWCLFLLFPVKYAVRWLARTTGSIENGPTMFFMTVVMMLLFGSAFFTDVIGVHAIFGAFLAGIIVPREGGLAIHLTEKLEDMVSIIFLPLYFTLSGLSTDLGLLDNGITWGYTIAIMSLAFTGKFCGCLLAAKYLAGFGWRESSTIGSLMSCKGLVELIVLNVGLSAGILNKRVFSMFVLEALVLTFMTTPLVTWLYPPHLRKRISATGANFDNVADDETARDARHNRSRAAAEGGGEYEKKTRFTVVLDRIEHVPGMMALTQLVQPPTHTERDTNSTSAIRLEKRAASSASSSSSHRYEPSMSVEALRLIELSDRVSAVMKSSVPDAMLLTDPLLSVFRMFGHLNDVQITPALEIVKYEDLVWSVVDHAGRYDADMVLVPWLPPVVNDAFEDGAGGTKGVVLLNSPMQAQYDTGTAPTTPRGPMGNPFDMLFRSAGGGAENSAAAIHSQFVRGIFAQAKTDVALFVDQTLPWSGATSGGSRQHLFLPFFGGPDDRLALDFVVQICENPKVTATAVKVTKQEIGSDVVRPLDAKIAEERREDINALTVASAVAGFPDTVYGHASTETRLQSETADSIAWGRYTSPGAPSLPALSRITFREIASPIPLQAIIQEAHAQAEASTASGDLLIIAGRSRRLAVENHRQELKALMDKHGAVGAEVRKTIGDVATAFVVSKCGSGVVVLQAAIYDS